MKLPFRWPGFPGIQPDTLAPRLLGYWHSNGGGAGGAVAGGSAVFPLSPAFMTHEFHFNQLSYLHDNSASLVIQGLQPNGVTWDNLSFNGVGLTAGVTEVVNEGGTQTGFYAPTASSIDQLPIPGNAGVSGRLTLFTPAPEDLLASGPMRGIIDAVGGVTAMRYVGRMTAPNTTFIAVRFCIGASNLLTGGEVACWGWPRPVSFFAL